MRTSNLAATLAAMLMGASGVAQAAEVLKTDRAQMNVGGRLQLLGFAQTLDDGHRNDERFYLFLKQARLSVSGNVDAWRYGVMLAFGGENEIKAPTPGISLGLLDMFVDAPLSFLGDNTYVRVGQFRVPYGRERLTESGTLLFADRSIQNMAFRVGRDVGAAIFTKKGPMVAGLGIFTGGGRDIPERYLPQTLGTPMVVLRAGYDQLGQDVFATPMAPIELDKTQLAFFVNGLYVEDSLVGHSTVFNTRASEKSLMINGNWNPFLGQAPYSLGRLWQVGADASVRTPVGPGVLTGEVEGNFAVYQNDYGDIRVPGGRAQVAYKWKQLDVALRYAYVRPDERFAVGDAQVTGKQAIQEVTPALTYNFEGVPAKIVMDLPILLGTPVIFEENVGSYVLTEQPDQTSLLKKGAPITRQNVVEARMMVQASF